MLQTARVPSSDLAERAPWPDSHSAASPQALARLVLRRHGWRLWLAPLVSIAVICAVLARIGHLDLAQVVRLVPAAPSFWVAFAAWYLTGPATDWIIFRRLWRLPAAGFVALMRKMISNELLLGYVGEVYFYGWARARAGLTGAPFGAIKDVAILSATTGNVVTLAMLIATWPLLGGLRFAVADRLLFFSLGVILSSSCAIMLLRRRLFTLPASALRFIASVQVARIALVTVLAAALWHLALPAAAASALLLLATIRLLISRLPLVPGKELVFAGAAAVLLGHQAGIAGALAMIGGLTLAAHGLLGLALALSEVLGLASHRRGAASAHVPPG